MTDGVEVHKCISLFYVNVRIKNSFKLGKILYLRQKKKKKMCFKYKFFIHYIACLISSYFYLFILNFCLATEMTHRRQSVNDIKVN